MFCLENILDEVREKYYSSKLLNRPTISWSDEYITDYFGRYDYFDNHITISRIFNDKRVSKEMIASVVYHESLHQDFQDHDADFNKKELLFPNCNQLKKQLNNFSEQLRNELSYNPNFNQFTKGKERIIYIILPRYDDYPEAFMYRDKNILIDFDAKVEFPIEESNKDLYVFLVKAKKQYHIVGWATKGKMAKERVIKEYVKYDEKFSYQLVSSYDHIYVIPKSCCDYFILEKDLPQKLKSNKCYCFNKNDEEIKDDLDYIESYCEGYEGVGFDLRTVDCIPDFKDISVEELKKIKKHGYLDVWLANAIYAKEPSYENLVKRALVKCNSNIFSSALDDFIEANKIRPEDTSVIYNIVKLAVLTEREDIQNQFNSKNNSIIKR